MLIINKCEPNYIATNAVSVADGGGSGRSTTSTTPKATSGCSAVSKPQNSTTAPLSTGCYASSYNLSSEECRKLVQDISDLQDDFDEYKKKRDAYQLANELFTAEKEKITSIKEAIFSKATTPITNIGSIGGKSLDPYNILGACDSLISNYEQAIDKLVTDSSDLHKKYKEKAQSTFSELSVAQSRARSAGC